MDIDKFPDGEPTPDELYRIVGEAISKFEEFEFYLSSLFSEAMGTSAHAGQLIWQSINSHETRIVMLKAAAQAARNEQRFFGNKAEFEEALVAVREAAKIRAEFAHGVVWSGTKGGYVLLRSFSKTIEKQFDPANVHNLKSLKLKLEEMDALRKVLTKFALPVLQHYSDRRLAATRTEQHGQ